MKIIDLLNKIANGEKVPKEIIFKGKKYHYKDGIDYENENKKGTYLLSVECVDIYFLNTEVEILEEEKKIPEKLPLIANTEVNYPDDEFLERILNLFYELNNKNRLKINEIIDYFEYLKSKGE